MEGGLFHPAALWEHSSSLSNAFVNEQQPIRNPTGLQGAESHSRTCGSAGGDGGICHGLVLNASCEIHAPVLADHDGSWVLRLHSRPQHGDAAAASPLMPLLCATVNSRRQGVQASSRELFTKDGCDPWGSLRGNEKRQCYLHPQEKNTSLVTECKQGHVSLCLLLALVMHCLESDHLSPNPPRSCSITSKLAALTTSAKGNITAPHILSFMKTSSFL